MFNVGDLVLVEAINPTDLPSERWESYIGKVGEVLEVLCERGLPTEVKLKFKRADAAFNTVEWFFPHSDKLSFVMKKEPDWIV